MQVDKNKLESESVGATFCSLQTAVVQAFLVHGFHILPILKTAAQNENFTLFQKPTRLTSTKNAPHLKQFCWQEVFVQWQAAVHTSVASNQLTKNGCCDKNKSFHLLGCPKCHGLQDANGSALNEHGLAFFQKISKAFHLQELSELSLSSVDFLTGAKFGGIHSPWPVCQFHKTQSKQLNSEAAKSESVSLAISAVLIAFCCVSPAMMCACELEPCVSVVHCGVDHIRDQDSVMRTTSSRFVMNHQSSQESSIAEI